MATLTRPEISSVRDVLDGVDSLVPTIRGRAAEIERARRVPAPVLQQLIDAGCFRVALPTSHGGLGADLAAFMRVLEALSRADGSVGWIVAIGGLGWRDMTALPRATFDALFPPGADVIPAGAFSPAATVVPRDGGFEVTGRWAFVSGCEHATWLYGNCMEAVDGQEPRVRTVVFAPDDIEIEDTWNVCGLRGTGSHHVRADDVLVPSDRTGLAFESEPCLDEPIVRIPPPALFALGVASVAVGLARGAVDDALELAGGRVPLLAGAPVAANPVFQFDLAVSDTELSAARALLHEHAEVAWATAAEGLAFEDEQRARIRAAAAWAVTRACDAVETSYRAGGSNALYDDSPLQRRLRDIQTLAQHFLVRRDTFTVAGGALAGQGIGVPVF